MPSSPSQGEEGSHQTSREQFRKPVELSVKSVELLGGIQTFDRGLLMRAPSTSNPSSVRVPVLSKQTTSSFPPTFTLAYVSVISEVSFFITHFCGLIQNILCFFSRERAKLVPIVSVAGRAGGTTIVIRSRARTMIKCQASYIRVSISDI